MGTNYYLWQDVCAVCGRPSSVLHIGKSSGGWCFSLHVDSDNGIEDLEDWQNRWNQKGSLIKDEYEDLVTPEMMLEIIINRTCADRKAPTPQWCKENHAKPGPNNLARHRIDERHCIKHGAGTWDCIIGEFS